jgi:uncharacterized membrane protein
MKTLTPGRNPPVDSAGRLVFAAAITALGVEHFLCAHFPGAVVPVIPWIPAYPPLVYLTGSALVAAGLAMALGRKARPAAILLGALFFGCALVLELPQVVQAPFDLSLRTGLFELLALGGAAWTLAARLPVDGKTSPLLDSVLRWGRYVFAASSVVFGITHLLIPEFIATLIPPWFPGGLFWAYFTGVAFIAAGVSLATQRLDRLAAALLGSMFLVWFLFLHVPRLTALPRAKDPDEWSSAFIALGLCGASWLMPHRRRREDAAAQPPKASSAPLSEASAPLSP